MHVPVFLLPRGILGALMFAVSILAVSPTAIAQQQPMRPQPPPFTVEQMNRFFAHLYGVDPKAFDNLLRRFAWEFEVEFVKTNILPELALVGILEVAARKQQGRFLSIAELVRTKRVRFDKNGRWGAYEFIETTRNRDAFEIVARLERETASESEIAKMRPISVSIREDLKLRAAEYGSREWVVVYDLGAALSKRGYDPTTADILPLENGAVELKRMEYDAQVAEVLKHLYRAQKEYYRRYGRYAEDELGFRMNQIKLPRFGDDRFDKSATNHLQRLGYNLLFFDSSQWGFVIAARPFTSPYGTKSVTKRALIVCGDGSIRDEDTKAVVADVR